MVVVVEVVEEEVEGLVVVEEEYSIVFVKILNDSNSIILFSL